MNAPARAFPAEPPTGGVSQDLIEFARALARSHVAREIARGRDSAHTRPAGADHANPDLRPL